MGTTSGIICLIIGIISIIASFFNPGSLILAAIAFIAAYANLKGNGTTVSRTPPPIHDPEAEVVACPHCYTENLAVAKVCRWCFKPLKETAHQ